MRDVGPVQLVQMRLNVARAHTAAVERQNLLVEPFQAGLALVHQLGLEGAIAVAGDAHT